MKPILPVLFLLAALASAAHPAEISEAEAKAICTKFSSPPTSKAVQPVESDRTLFAEEDCTRYVYADPGEGRDYGKARRCCLATGSCDHELAMIFANGWGTPRDYDAATYFVCRSAGSMASAELWGMLGHLREMRAASHPKDLVFCEWVTSGVGMAYCEGLEHDAKRPKWDRRIAAVERGLAAEARTALDALAKAAQAFVEQDSTFLAEPSRGGTGYPSFVIANEIEASEAWVATLERYAAHRAPVATAEAFARADRDLNATYKTVRAAMKSEETLPGGPETLLEAQRAWLRYRDAWTAFYRLRWKGAAAPEALDREIQTALTRERVKQWIKAREEG